MSRGKHFPLRRPRSVNGIRSQATRAGTTRADWARKWFAALERMDLGGRFGRGRNYAMSGQVAELRIDGNRVTASVQGVRAEKYAVTADFRRVEGAARKRIVAALRREPMFIARLLAGEMPLEVEEIFRREGFPLYPGEKMESARKRADAGRLYDTVLECSCPDYANPCKHVFAALIILGEEIARRPALLLELRGITLEELL